MFFSLYVADVVSLVLGCGIGVHMYADDLQIYSSDCLVNVSSLTDRLMWRLEGGFLLTS